MTDLRFASEETHLQWNAIVLGGLRASRGMASFADALSAADAQAIRAYVVERAWADPGLVGRALGLYRSSERSSRVKTSRQRFAVKDSIPYTHTFGGSITKAETTHENTGSAPVSEGRI